jgi:eukaryotic-like serine/threonine-protein kinase
LSAAGVIRHGQMNLLGWCATFGVDASYDDLLREPRQLADDAAAGSWVPHDRATLGVLFYRGLELLRLGEAGRARTLLKLSAGASRANKMLDVVPVALGLWAEAERQSGDARASATLAQEGALMLETGAPSLLNEAPVFLALHDAFIDLGETERAREAVLSGLPHLKRRAEALRGTPYARPFLSELSANAGLIGAARRYDAFPGSLASLLD